MKNHTCTNLFRGQLATRFINIFNLDIRLVVILFLKILSEASVFLPPAVLVINIPAVERKGNRLGFFSFLFLNKNHWGKYFYVYSHLVFDAVVIVRQNWFWVFDTSHLQHLCVQQP